jgi:hypothetical protein
LPPGAAIPFAPPSYATDFGPQTSGNSCSSFSDPLILLISVGHVHDILNVISQEKVVGHKTDDLVGKDQAAYLTCLDTVQNFAVATVQAVEVENFQQDGCDARSDRFPIVGQ